MRGKTVIALPVMAVAVTSVIAFGNKALKPSRAHSAEATVLQQSSSAGQQLDIPKSGLLDVFAPIDIIPSGAGADSFVVTLRNDSGKPITAIAAARNAAFQPGHGEYEYNVKDYATSLEVKPLRPGETVTVTVENNGKPFRIAGVVFEDGSTLGEQPAIDTLLGPRHSFETDLAKELDRLLSAKENGGFTRARAASYIASVHDRIREARETRGAQSGPPHTSTAIPVIEATLNKLEAAYPPERAAARLAELIDARIHGPKGGVN